MATLAIKGHKTRGKEVIKILEMLGGDNKYHINITECDLLYTIREGDDVIIGTYPNSSISQIYTLEEFLEKFPYKVGDKVSSKYLKNYKIEKMEWVATNNKVIYKLQGMGWYNVRELQPYKEETTEENNEKSANHVFDTEVITFDIAQRDKYELDLQGKFQVVSREGKYYVERIKPKYPTTYEECCKVLGIDVSRTIGHSEDLPFYNDVTCYENNLLSSLVVLRKLRVCRDAYWKIAGEQMGLGKPWEPDWKNPSERKYCIVNTEGNITKWVQKTTNKILAFPTAEMRDAYKENFDNDIEICKDFL